MNFLVSYVLTSIFWRLFFAFRRGDLYIPMTGKQPQMPIIGYNTLAFLAGATGANLVFQLCVCGSTIRERYLHICFLLFHLASLAQRASVLLAFEVWAPSKSLFLQLSLGF